ncbi:MAG: N-acetylglucosamine-6-phosphate deacetylase [Verrucomicrobiales bacterium]
MRTLLRNARVISPGIDAPGMSILIEHGRIASVNRDLTEADDETDCNRAMVLPGFIDIHTHGGAGSDVSDGNLEAVRSVARAKLREGVTTFLPTTLTLPHDELVAAARAVAAYRRQPDFAKAPGMHVEGPFINPKCVGAQNPAFVRPPSAAEIFELNSIAPVAIVSMAIEMPGGMDFVREMAAAGIITSLAHTAATFAQFQEAKRAGLRHLTHFCNQMTPLHHREIGIVGAGLVDTDVMIELICDTIHVCPEMIALALNYKSPRQFMLITDSMAASWIGDGETRIGGLRVTVKEGQARLDSGTLAGSTLRYNHGLRNFHQITGLPLADLVQTTSWNQARSLGFEGVGKIEPGFAADLVMLDDDFEVKATFVNGEVRFRC